MNRKDKHISKYLHDPLPAPEIPADDAWTGMNGMLDAAGGHGGSTQGGQSGTGQFWKSILKFKGLLTTVSGIAVVSAVGVLVMNNQDNAKKESAPKQQQTLFEERAEMDSIDNAANAGANKSSGLTTGNAAEIVDSVHIKNSEASSLPGGPIAAHVDARPSSSAVHTPGNAAETAGRGVSAHNAGSKAAGEGTRQGDLAKLKSNATKSERSASRPGSNANSIRNASEPVFGRSTETAFRRTPTDQRRTTTAERDVSPNREQLSGRTSPHAATGHAGNPITANTGRDFNTASASRETSEELLPKTGRLNSLRPLPGHFEGSAKSFAGLVKAPVTSAPQPASKPRRGPVQQSFHFGPEWGFNGEDMNSPYLLTGADSIRRIGRLAVPGLFFTKTWDRHGVTFVFTPLNSYFGMNQRIQRDADTVLVTDSLTVLLYTNTNFIKATGMNFSLQYQYAATGWLSFNAGVGYATFTKALLRTETENYNGNILQGPLLTVKKSDDFNSYIKNRQWTLRAGVIAHPAATLNGRLQMGTDVVVPVSNLAKNSEFHVQSLNWRIYLRFLIK